MPGGYLSRRVTGLNPFRKSKNGKSNFNEDFKFNEPDCLKWHFSTPSPSGGAITHFYHNPINLS
jgi:hypothetical protein